MNKALGWIRSNLLIVIFGVLALIAIIGLPLLAKNRNSHVSQEMTKRVQILRDLESLERTQVTLEIGGLGDRPPVQIDQRAVVNAALLQSLRTVSQRQTEDAQGIFEAAEEFNRGSHTILMPELFPKPDIGSALWGLRFHRVMEQAYADLRQRVRAGAPPSADLMLADIERRRRQFLTATLQKDDGDPLTEDEQTRLAETLAQTRIALLARAAEDMLFYCPADLLPLPAFDQQRSYTLDELFRWQWEYWVVSDVLEALAAANREGGNVLRGPVKRVVSIQPLITMRPPASGGGAAEPSGSGFDGGFGGEGGGRGGEEAAAGASGVTPNPDTPIQVDYRDRYTGRTTNSLYDVFDVRLELVVETSLIPQVLDAFAQQNFMTVVDFRVRPGESVEALRNGFVYGSAPVSTVELLLETVWFRTWTAAMMPEPVRAAMAVALPPEPGSMPGMDETEGQF